ncbi:hypothetical protein, partial [Actinocorallia lasiicapitis]
ACRTGDRVDCTVTALAPGASLEIAIEARSSADRAPGDALRIHTFVGRFQPNRASGGLDYDVAARGETGGDFVASPPALAG